MGANAPAMQMDEMRDVRENKQSSVGDLKPKKTCNWSAEQQLLVRTKTDVSTQQYWRLRKRKKRRAQETKN